MSNGCATGPSKTTPSSSLPKSRHSWCPERKATAMPRNFYFTSHGVRCAAWHIPANTDALTGVAGRPCAVMAHGFSGTRDTGLLSFAELIADAGIDVVIFDYRGFGDSEGEPRQDI